MFKVGDKITGNSDELYIFKDRLCTVIEVTYDTFKVDNLPAEYDNIFWSYTPQFKLVERKAYNAVKCPLCGNDPCRCAEDDDLEKCDLAASDGFCHTHHSMACDPSNPRNIVQAISSKDFILLEACKQSWPSAKMTAAILLNELEE